MAEEFSTEVELPAPVEEVFRHLTDPAAMVRWMGQHATLTPVAGGTRLRLVHRGLSSGQEQIHAAGWEFFLSVLIRVSGSAAG